LTWIRFQDYHFVLLVDADPELAGGILIDQERDGVPAIWPKPSWIIRPRSLETFYPDTQSNHPKGHEKLLSRMPSYHEED
jgi:hypothetical protein